MVALLFSSLINVVLFFRVFEIGFFEPFSDHEGHEHHPAVMAEAPLSMLVPLYIVAAGLIVVGLYTGDIVNHIVQFVIPKGFM